RKLLDAIDQKQLNDEQAAEFAVADAQQSALADDKKARASKLDTAAATADRAHSGALKIRVDFERVRLALADNDKTRAATLMKQIGEQSLRLNDVPLRLSWLELQMALALRTGNAAAAAEHYRETLPLLKNVATYAYAGLLHGMGEVALANDQ